MTAQRYDHGAVAAGHIREVEAGVAHARPGRKRDRCGGGGGVHGASWSSRSAAASAAMGTFRCSWPTAAGSSPSTTGRAPRAAPAQTCSSWPTPTTAATTTGRRWSGGATRSERWQRRCPARSPDCARPTTRPGGCRWRRCSNRRSRRPMPASRWPGTSCWRPSHGSPRSARSRRRRPFCWTAAIRSPTTPTSAATRRLDTSALAATLRAVAAEGPAGFHGGAAARAIEAEVARGGGILTAADIEGYRPKIMHESPASVTAVSQYVTANDQVGYEVLNLLDQFPPQRRAAPSSITCMAEAFGHAFVDNVVWFGDDEHVESPLAGLASRDFARRGPPTSGSTGAAPRPITGRPVAVRSGARKSPGTTQIDRSRRRRQRGGADHHGRTRFRLAGVRRGGRAVSSTARWSTTTLGRAGATRSPRARCPTSPSRASWRPATAERCTGRAAPAGTGF